MSDLSHPTHRRGFLGRVAAAAAGAAAAGILPRRLTAEVSAASPPDDAWLKNLKGKHRQFFDMPQPAGGLPMIHVRNYMNTYESAYGLKHPDVSAVAGLYFMTVPLGFTDAMWEKYQLGKAANVTDSSTNAPAVRNVFWSARAGQSTLDVAGAVPLPLDASMESLQKRGVTYILCNNAFNFWMGNIARATNQEPAAVRKEFEANMLPNITVVPAMVVAINQAQAAGVTYMFLP